MLYTMQQQLELTHSAWQDERKAIARAKIRRNIERHGLDTIAKLLEIFKQQPTEFNQRKLQLAIDATYYSELYSKQQGAIHTAMKEMQAIEEANGLFILPF